MPKLIILENNKETYVSNKQVFVPPKEVWKPTIGGVDKYSTYELMMRFGFDPVRALFFTN